MLIRSYKLTRTFVLKGIAKELLKELTAQEKSAHVFKANHESLEDTYKDAANYALIGLLLQRKRWR